MRIWLQFTTLLFTSLAVLAAGAAEFRTGDKKVVIDAPIADDLYVFGDEIEIKANVDGHVIAFGRKVILDKAATVSGDVVVFGNLVTIDGTVEGQVMAAGQSVALNGTAEGARVAGQVLKLGSTSKLKDDLLAAGYSLELQKDSEVAGDALYGGFQALFAGNIKEDLWAGLGNCRLAGAVGGDVHLDVGGKPGSKSPPVYGLPPEVALPDVPGGLTIAESASVEGDLNYESSQEANMEAMAKIAGKTNFHKTDSAGRKANANAPPRNPTLDRALVRGRHVVAVLIVGFVVLLVAPRWSRAWADNIRTRPGASLLGGIVGLLLFIALLIVALVVIFAAAFLLGRATLHELVPMVIVGGLVGYVAMVVGVWLLFAFLAEALAGLALGRVLIGGDSLLMRVVALVLGLIVVGLLLSIPVVGWWIGVVIFLFGLGGYCLWLIGYGSTEPFGPPMQPARVEKPLPSRLEKLPPPAPRV